MTATTSDLPVNYFFKPAGNLLAAPNEGRSHFVGRKLGMPDETSRLKFSLNDVPLQKRSRVWMDTLNEFFYDYDHSLPKDIVNGNFSGGKAGKLSVASVESDAMTVYRTSSHITRDALDAYFVLMTTKEQIGLHQRGREASLNANEFALVSTSDKYIYTQDKTTVFHNLIIPGPLIRQFAPQIDDTVAIGSRNDVVSRMFYQFASSLCIEVQNLDLKSGAAIAHQAVDLLALVLDGVDDKSTATTIQTINYRRFIKYIANNYSNPELNIHSIVKEFKLSPRYIQSIFESQNTTVTRTIRQRRISEASFLIKANNSNMYITEICFQVGFNNLSHFSRVFKQETGYTPSDYGNYPRP